MKKNSFINLDKSEMTMPLSMFFGLAEILDGVIRLGSFGLVYSSFAFHIVMLDAKKRSRKRSKS